MKRKTALPSTCSDLSAQFPDIYSPSSVIAATVQSCVGVKTAQFSRLHTTFYLQRLELCRQKVVQNVACGPAFKTPLLPRFMVDHSGI